MQSEMLETGQPRTLHPTAHLITRLLQYGQRTRTTLPTDFRQVMPNRLDISWHLRISFCRGERGTWVGLLRRYQLHCG